MNHELHEQNIHGTTSNTSRRGRFIAPTADLSAPLPTHAASCELDAAGHCITCSDEALPVRVLHVDPETGLATVEVKDTTEEIDITLVDHVVPGDVLLVHGGVAIGHLDEANDE